MPPLPLLANPLPPAPVPLQHSSVYTIGKRGKEADFKLPLQVGPHAAMRLHAAMRPHAASPWAALWAAWTGLLLGEARPAGKLV